MLRLLGTATFEDKALTLERSLYVVALLVCHNTWMTREELMLLLWAENESENVLRQRLRQLLYRTKKMFYASGLEVNSTHVCFVASSDVQLFRTAIKQRNWSQAIALYQGE